MALHLSEVVEHRPDEHAQGIHFCAVGMAAAGCHAHRRKNCASRRRRRGVKKREDLNSYVAFCIATAMLYYGFIPIDVYVQVLLYCLVLSPK